jgi:hypothetical protein
MAFNEDSRVKIPAVVHLIRLIDFEDFNNNSFNLVTELSKK